MVEGDRVVDWIRSRCNMAFEICCDRSTLQGKERGLYVKIIDVLACSEGLENICWDPSRHSL